MIRMDNILSEQAYERIDAVDGTNHNIPYTRSPLWHDPWTHRHITCGEVGCALSHLRAWKRIADGDAPAGLILEDDVVFLGGAGRALSTLDATVPAHLPYEDFDLLYLGRKVVSDASEDSPAGNGLVRVHSYSYWLCSYLLTRRGALKLISMGIDAHLIPSDEFVPWAIGAHPHNELVGKPPEGANCLCAYAFDTPLARPRDSAFQVSSTFFSSPSSPSTLLTLVTVATHENSALHRFRRSAALYGFSVRVLGMGMQWKGGNMAAGPGGGQKVLLFQEYLEEEHEEDSIILFTDSYDVTINDHVLRACGAFTAAKCDVLFAAERTCWPDKNRESEYPPSAAEHKYLNSGGICGKVRSLRVLTSRTINADDDDQRYYTDAYLSPPAELSIKVDHECSLFVCLADSYPSDSFAIYRSKGCLYYGQNRPAVIHGNGISKLHLDVISDLTLENNTVYGTEALRRSSDDAVTLLLDFRTHAPYPEFWDGVVIQNAKIVQCLYLGPPTEFPPTLAERVHIRRCTTLTDAVQTVSTGFLFFMKCEVVLTDKECVTTLLCHAETSVVSPVLVEKNSRFSNFWGAVTSQGFYARSDTYLDICSGNLRGRWNVPYAWYALLIPFGLRHLLTDLGPDLGDEDMGFTRKVRGSGTFMYAINTHNMGYLCRSLTSQYANPAMHPLGRSELSPLRPLGDDLFELDVFTPDMCRYIIDTVEERACWSRGGDRHYDSRLGSYENHPTSDIHLSEIGLGEAWEAFLHSHIAPRVWDEFQFTTTGVNISFVVKYSLDIQKELKPHHDSSSYTINICLNDEFKGGGVYFLRSKRTIRHTKVGSAILHPGKVTHMHEGLPLIEGVRYILVTFVK